MKPGIYVALANFPLMRGVDLATLAYQAAEAGRDAWVEAASTQLTTTREVYLRAIQETRMTGGRTAIVELDIDAEPLAGWVEGGLAPWEMTPDLFGSKAKTAKDGSRYVDVQFRHALNATGAKAFSVADFASAYHPRDSVAMVGQAFRAVTSKSGATRIGHTVARKLAPLRIGTRVASPHKQGSYAKFEHHTSPIYADMKKTGSGQAMTWRRLSSKKPWQNPGIEAHNLAEIGQDAAEAYLVGETETIVEQYLAATFG